MRYKVSISVIMTCFNSEKFIKKAIESVLEQSFVDWELIIIDDGSTDNTSEIINRFSDNRIRYFKLSINKGTYPARNFAFEIANGKYFTLLDSDDISLPHRFKIQFEYLENHKNIGCLGSSFQLIDEYDLPIGVVSRPTNYQEVRVILLKDNCIAHIMFRSYLFRLRSLKYDCNFVFSADYDFHFRISEQYKIVNIDQILTQYRVHKGQITSSKRAGQTEFADQIRLRQLSNFDIPISDVEKELHLKLMKGMYISTPDLQKCETWLNKLLEANYFKGLYSDRHLYAFFQNAISFAIRNNSGN